MQAASKSGAAAISAADVSAAQNDDFADQVLPESVAPPQLPTARLYVGMMEDRTRGSGRPASQDAAFAIAAAAGVVPLEPYRNANAAWLCRCLACGRG